MRAARIAFAAALIITLVPLQYAVVNRLPWPGAGPDLLLVAVAAVALARGSNAGIVFGFSAGVVADLAPPADHTLGRLALSYALAGFVAGLFATETPRSVLAPMIVVGIAALVAEGTFVITGALLGDDRITTTALAHNVASSVLYDVILAPFFVPLVGAVSRRLDAEPARR